MLAGKLRLEPTVVGLSKFNESVQKLKNGPVAGYVASNPCFRGCRLQQRLKMSERVVMDVLDAKRGSIGSSGALEAVRRY
jgi:hypothetical protein